MITTTEGREELRKELTLRHDCCGNSPVHRKSEDVLDLQAALDALDIAQEMARLLRLLTACHQGLPNVGCTYCDILAEWDTWKGKEE